MPLQIRDETANVLVLTIDDTGLICFGNGTPVSTVSVNGTAVVNSAGLITNQRVNGSTLLPTTGTVSCDPGQYTTVTTASGRLATVQVESVWPAVKAIYHTEGIDGEGRRTPEYCEFVNQYNYPSHQVISLDVGSFTVINRDQLDDLGLCPISGHGSLATYRWF